MRLHGVRLGRGLPECSPDTGAYCRARRRLSYDLIVLLFRRVAQRLHDALPDESLLWCERRVKIVDGSTVSMPDTPANQARFPQQRAQKPGLGFPIARLVALFLRYLRTGLLEQWCHFGYRHVCVSRQRE